MKFALFLLSCALVVSCLATNTTVRMPNNVVYENCGSPSDFGVTNSMTMSGNHLWEEEEMTVFANFTFMHFIDLGAYALYTKTENSITERTQRIDICMEEALREQQIAACPLDKGDHLIPFTKRMPSTIRPVIYQILIEVFDKEDRRLFCSRFTFDFTRPGPNTRARSHNRHIGARGLYA